ncbi:ABC transporter substrate-binding protein [Solibacillus sp. FSL K6-4121]|uniref:ABC transporter substrate-binding protein n=1 Tax=Solibacillus sp. FSL K6-4121 TaxID=2921505 RepID=UPI0030FA6864
MKDQRTETSIAEIAKLLNCSTRYAKTIVHQLEENQKIRWETARGRGKKPFITMLRNSDTILLEWISELWEIGNYEVALEIIKRYDMTQNSNIQAWLNSKLGLQSIEDEHIFVQQMYEVELFLDPLKSISRHDSHMMEQIHETLFGIDEKGNIFNNLVFAYDTQDYRTWSFVLKKGVKFHDGTILTAEEVVASIAYISERYKEIYEIAQMNVLSKYELIIQLKKPFSLLPTFFASPRLVMLTKSLNPEIGCGPFQLKQLSNDKIILEAFQSYFKERPWIDRVELFITESEVASPISHMPIEDEPYRVIEQQEEGATYLFFNSSREAFSSEEARAYIWHNILPEQFVLNPYYEQPAYGWLTSSHKVQVEAPQLIKPDLKEPIIIGYQQIREGVNHLPQAEKLQEILAEHNIEAELQCINFQQPTAERFKKMDLFVGGMAILRNLNLSFYNYYTTYGKDLISTMNEQDCKRAFNLFEEAKTSHNPLLEFEEIEQFLQTSYHLKFLKHRKHYYYVRENSNFDHVVFDNHGRIDYRKLYVSTNEHKKYTL